MNYFFKHPPLILLLLLCLFNNIFSDPLYLNNANPFPIFSTQGRYDYLTRISRDTIKEFIFNGENINDALLDDDKIFHANIMPYIQTASNGTNYLGESSLDAYNNKNASAISINATNIIENSIPQGNAQQAAANNNAAANLIYRVDMPLGAIPEPFNFFALFYANPIDPIEPLVYKTGNLLEAEYNFIIDQQNPEVTDALIAAEKAAPVPSGKSNFNQVAKVVARYLGMNDTPAILNDNLGNISGNSVAANSLGAALPNSLMYDYSNYKNNYFGLLQYPASRDPKKLFGYGYFKSNYQKTGIRGTLEWKINKNFGIKIYTGFSNLEISQINIIDTTINYQGPNAAMMLSRYPDPIYQLTTNNSPQAPTPYIQPNIYSLTDYKTPIMDNTSNGLFNSNFYNYSELNNYLPDEFKTAFLQNIQYNLNNLGELINQNFRPYSAQSFDDTTIELFYRRLIVYNKPHKDKNSDIKIEHMPYTFLPTAAIHVTCPIAPRVPGNKIFGKPIDNNGHWELGANLGVEFDFINNIVLGSDVGFSWYNQSNYSNVPIPTNQFNEGIYLYNANLIKTPGYSYTIGIGMQVDELFDCVNFFTEYRLINHAEDDFIIQSINNLLPIKYMENTHTSPSSDEQNTLDTIPNGILYLNYNQLPPYPKTAIIEHMRETSSWMVQLINLTVNYKINSNMSLGFAWQQPFFLRNAYNASTLGISFEMYL